MSMISVGVSFAGDQLVESYVFWYIYKSCLSRIFHELLSRDREDGGTTWQSQGVGSEAHLNGTSQGPAPEDARKDDFIDCRLRIGDLRLHKTE
jgi:hypothetical protein